MSWAKLDDQFHGHRKAKIAWKSHPRALGLHLLALSYCAGHLTDGFIDEEFVEEKLPHAREREQVTEALLTARLWTREGEGWRVNNWLDYNPSRAEILDRRRRDAERKARRRRPEPEGSPSGRGADAARRPVDSSRARAFPDPTRPDPIPPEPPPSGGRRRDRDKWERAAVTWARAIGFTAVDAELVRAVRQAKPWEHNGNAAEHFGAFVKQHFPRTIAS